jgi:hypothetical protein
MFFRIEQSLSRRMQSVTTNPSLSLISYSMRGIKPVLEAYSFGADIHVLSETDWALPAQPAQRRFLTSKMLIARSPSAASAGIVDI